MASRLEARLSKDEILTRYLDNVYFGAGGGDVQLDFQPTGLICRIDAPWAAIMDRGADSRG